MRILRENTVVLAIDFQEKLMPSIYNGNEIIESAAILLKGIKELEIPVIVTQQYTKGLGDTHSEIKNVAVDINNVYDKMSFSAYEDENIKNAIVSLERKNIILCGAEAHVCVLQTLIDLRDEGYNVILVEDCIGSRKQIDKNCAIKRAIFEGAIISSSEAILFELTRRANNDVFKKILGLVKNTSRYAT